MYALAGADNPTPTEFVNIADFHFNTVHANDFSFYEEVNMIVQEEPTTALDPERAGQLAGIGIVHGHPFAPDERRRATLDTAAHAAAAISRALAYAPRDPEAVIFEGSSWLMPSSEEVTSSCATALDCWTLVLRSTTSPPSSHRRWRMPRSARGRPTPTRLGTPMVTSSTWAKAYTLTLPADPPAKNFWSVDVYDTQTGSLLQTDNPYPSVMSHGDTVVANDAGRTLFGSGRRRHPGTSVTGSRRWPAKAGSRGPLVRAAPGRVRKDVEAEERFDRIEQ